MSSIDPPHAICLINHALGVTAEQHVYFSPDAKRGTVVRMTLEMIGKPFELSETTIHDAAGFVVKDALDTMAALCQRRASSASSR